MNAFDRGQPFKANGIIFLSQRGREEVTYIPQQCHHGEMRKFCSDCSPAFRKRKEAVQRRLQLEGIGAIMVGEYLHSSLQLYKETSRYYYFIKGDVRIRITKRALDERLESAKEAEKK